MVLGVPDPQGNVGSGGATLNALVVVAERLSAQRGETFINPDARRLRSKRWGLGSV